MRNLRDLARRDKYEPDQFGICNYGSEWGAYALYAAAAAAAVSGAAAYKSSQSQARAEALQRKQARLSEMRERRELVRKARITAAETQQSAENQGVSGSSAAQGGIGSIQTQLGSNLSFLDQYGALSDRISSANQKAGNYAGWSSVFGQVSSALGGAYVSAPSGGGNNTASTAQGKYIFNTGG